MIDWDKYDPAKDADEHENHLCNSLNATYGMLEQSIRCNKSEYTIVQTKVIKNTCDYLERAQATITYLRKKLEEKENI